MVSGLLNGIVLAK